MDTRKAAPFGPSVIVHSNVLVAEDLRELLQAQGPMRVETRKTLDEAEGLSAHFVILEVTDGGHELTHPQVERWRRLGVPILMLNGHTGPVAEDDGIFRIEQPFRSEEVLAVLRQLAIF